MTYRPEIEGNVTIGAGARFGPNVRLLAGLSGEIRIGARCHLKTGTIIACYGGIVTIGERVSIGEYSVIYGHGGVTIEDCAAIGPHCVISSQEHIVGSRVALRFAGEMLMPVRIGFGALVSAQCVVTAGVTVGRRTIVGAGSVVTGTIEEDSVAFGTPCKITECVGESRLYGHNDRDIERDESGET